MTPTRETGPLVRDAVTDEAQQPALARRVVDRLGGRYSIALGIDVDGGRAQVEQWFVAATLFGARMPVGAVHDIFRVLERAGLVRIRQARHVPWEDLVRLLRRGGHSRYDERIATLLRQLSATVHERYDGQVRTIAKDADAYDRLRRTLEALPGWGPTTTRIFLREMRGTWPGADPPMDQRALRSAEHLGLSGPPGAGGALARLSRLADAAGLDIRDLEGSLIRLTLVHRRGYQPCDGGAACVVLTGPVLPLA